MSNDIYTITTDAMTQPLKLVAYFLKLETSVDEQTAKPVAIGFIVLISYCL